MTDPSNLMRLRDEADVMPEAVPYLRLGSGLPSWGWDCEASGLPEPEGHPERVIAWGFVALVAWIVALWLLALALGWRPWRGWL